MPDEDSSRYQHRRSTDILKEQNAQFEKEQNDRKSKYLQDFNEYTDDCSTIGDDDLEKLGRYARFEKSFPFYKMDVNGFMVLMKRAMRLTYENEPEKPLW